MLNKNKIKIYKSYKGNIDQWARVGKKKENILDDQDWSLINKFIQDILIVDRGLASIEFAHNLNEKLKENCDSEDTINELLELAKKMNL